MLSELFDHPLLVVSELLIEQMVGLYVESTRRLRRVDVPPLPVVRVPAAASGTTAAVVPPHDVHVIHIRLVPESGILRLPHHVVAAALRACRRQPVARARVLVLPPFHLPVQFVRVAEAASEHVHLHVRVPIYHRMEWLVLGEVPVGLLDDVLLVFGGDFSLEHSVTADDAVYSRMALACNQQQQQ